LERTRKSSAPFNTTLGIAMTATRERITNWLMYLVPISVLGWVVWAPETFDLVLSYVLRHSLELALPAFTHGYFLWRAWLYSGRKRWLLRVTCSVISAGVLASLYAHYTFTTFALATGVPGLYAIATVLLEQTERKSGNS
jgi:hypothetical protein